MQYLNADTQAVQPLVGWLSRYSWTIFCFILLVSIFMIFKSLSLMKQGKTYVRYSLYSFVVMAVMSAIFILYTWFYMKYSEFLLSHESFTRIFYYVFFSLTVLMLLLCFFLVLRYLQEFRKACREKKLSFWQALLREP